MPTRLQIVDAALVRLGAQPLGDETAPGASEHTGLFDGVASALLAVNPWSWNTVTRRLSRRTAPPSYPYYSYAFDLPPDMAGAPRAVFDDPTGRRPTLSWEILDGALNTNSADVWLHMDKTPAPAAWPGYFSELVVLALMAEMALSVREDPVLRERLRGDCYGMPSEGGLGGLLGRAMLIDAQGKPQPVMDLSATPLIAARRQW